MAPTPHEKPRDHDLGDLRHVTAQAKDGENASETPRQPDRSWQRRRDLHAGLRPR